MDLNIKLQQEINERINQIQYNLKKGRLSEKAKYFAEGALYEMQDLIEWLANEPHTITDLTINT